MTLQLKVHILELILFIIDILLIIYVNRKRDGAGRFS